MKIVDLLKLLKTEDGPRPSHNEANILMESHSCFYTSAISRDIHENISDIIYQNQLYSPETEVH